MSWFKSKRTVSRAAVVEALNTANALKDDSIIHGWTGHSPIPLFTGKWAYCTPDCEHFHPQNESGFDKMPKKELPTIDDYFLNLHEPVLEAEEFGGQGCGDSGR